MEFPHLKDTRFPNFDTVDVYAFKNEFNYMRWTPQTKIRLVNVLWNSDYNDVVKFDTNDMRDNWFDSITDFYSITLESDQRMLPDAEKGNSIKLPIPFDVLARYNYMYIEVPIATSENELIDYETINGVRRWYFFIMDIDSLAPNTTRVFLSLDYWTNFINDCDIAYMQLERGHAPVAFSDTDKYLQNPIDENEYLLTPDVNFGNTTICRDSKFIPLGNGKKWFCLASVCSPDEVRNLGTASSNGNYTFSNPTFSNDTGRWGYQIIVENYGFGNGRDFSNLSTADISTTESCAYRIPNGMYFYAIEADKIFTNDVGNVFDTIKSVKPNFFRTIKATFIVDEAFLKFNATTSDVTFGDYRFRQCYGVSKKPILTNFNIDKNMFGFNTEQMQYAKLFTYPYSFIELTDNDGKSIEVHIEDTTTINAYADFGMAYPFMDFRVFFEGIGGSGNNAYSWIDLRNTKNNMKIANSDWYSFCWDWDIPCYGIFIDGQTDFLLNGFNSYMKYARENAIIDYKNTVRSADNARENAVDLADVANTNAYAHANTIVANTANTNTANTANTNTTNATNTANTTAGNDAKTADYGYSGNYKSRTKDAANSLISITTTAENQRTVATTGMNNTANQLTGTLSGAVSGGMTGAALGGPYGAAAGALLGAATSLGSSLISSGAADANCTAITNANSAIAGATTAKNDACYNAAIYYDANSTANTNSLQSTLTANNNACASSVTATNNAANAANAANNANTIKANADRDEDVADSNATYTRNAAVTNAQQQLMKTQNNARARLYDARNAEPKQIGQYSGNPQNDYFMNRGIQIKARTQSKNAIKQTADYFARYGYALNQYWDIKNTGFKLMKNFTYWKVQDVWIDDRVSSTNVAQDMIITILKRGITVWNNPDSIGKVNIYDN